MNSTEPSIDPRAAYCGLFCGACPLHIATREKGGIKAEDGSLQACDGCRSRERLGDWCAHCPLKTCARAKGFAFCGDCPDYPCAPFAEFRDDPTHAYHGECPDHLKTIRAEGWRPWLASMETKWRCPGCGAALSWWHQTCPSCGAPAPGYEEPTGS